MDRVKFSNINEFSKQIVEKLKYIQDEYPVVSVYGKFEIIKELLESLIASGIKIYNSIELEDSDVLGYDREFELSVTKDGLSVCKLWHEDNEYCKAGYYTSGGNTTFVHEDCNSSILSHIDSDDIYEFAIGGECECKCNDRDAKTCASKSVYKVNGKEVSEKEFTKNLDEMDEILNYVVDRMTRMLRRF